MQRIYVMNVMPLLDISMREEALDFMEEERRRHLSALKPERSKAQSVGAGLLLAYAVNMAGEPAAGDPAMSDFTVSALTADAIAASDPAASDPTTGGLAESDFAAGERGPVISEDSSYEEVSLSDVLSALKNAVPQRRNNFKIERTSTGKPYFSNCDHLYFNLSHSGEYAACVLADHEVGVDIQKVQGAAAVRRIAPRILHAGEAAYREEESMLYRIWTIKEAYVKATGEGIRRDFRKIRVDFEKGTVEDMPFTLWESIPGYTLAVCHASSPSH